MFRIRLPNGVEMVFPSAEEFQAAVASGVVTPDSEIFHQKAERWVPIASHPTYHRAVSATRAAAHSTAPSHPSPTHTAPAQAPSVPVATMQQPVRRVVPVTPATLAASRPQAAQAPSAPRPAVAPPISQSAQRPRLAVEPQAPPAPAVPPLGASAQRPAISIPPVAAAPSAPPAPVKPVLRTAPPPAPVAPPAGRSNELKFVDTGAESPRSSAPVQASAPRAALHHSAPAQAIAIEAPARPDTLADLTDAFDILEDIGSEASEATVELPARPIVVRPEPPAHVPPPPASARPSRPSAPVHHAEAPAAEEHHHHAAAPAAAPIPRRGSARMLIAAGIGAAIIGGGALVAWRSGSAKPPVTVAQTAAPNATTAGYTQSPKPESALAAPATTPASTSPSQVTTTPASQKPATPEPKSSTPAPAPAPTHPATVVAAPAADSSPILPGRPQSMNVDLDVSGAVVGTTVGGGAAGSAGPNLGIIADHYGDAAAEAGKQLEARLGGIGFSRLIAPLRFGSVESMEGARHTLSSAVGMVAAYRSRIQALEKVYGDSAAQAQRNGKPGPKEMLAWNQRLPNRESAEAAQAVDLALSKVDQLYAALLAHPEKVKVDASSVTISDPDLAKQYQSLRQWLSQRFDGWSNSPADAVPPTVRQTMKAFSDALSH